MQPANVTPDWPGEQARPSACDFTRNRLEAGRPRRSGPSQNPDHKYHSQQKPRVNLLHPRVRRLHFGGETIPCRLCPRSRRARTQPQEHRRRHSPRCARRGSRACPVSGKSVACAVSGTLYAEAQRSYFELRRALRAAAGIEQVGGARSRRDRRPAARRRAPAAARHADTRGRRWAARHHAVEPRAHALFAHWRLLAEAADALRRGLLAEHGPGRVPDVSRTRARLRGRGTPLAPVRH